MRALDSTERILLRLERPGYPFDIAEIILLESSPEGPLPFEQVRAVFNQRCHRSAPLTRVAAPAPLGIGEDRWTPAANLNIGRAGPPSRDKIVATTSSKPSGAPICFIPARMPG